MAILLTGCYATQGTATAPLVAALKQAKASTEQAAADNAKVRELARGMGKGVVKLDRSLDTIDFKTIKLLELLE
jgi:hypothetical protein